MDTRLKESTIAPLCEKTGLTHFQVYDWLREEKARIRKKKTFNLN